MSDVATLVLKNGRVRSPGTPSGFAEALALRGTSIVAVGDDAAIDELIAPTTRVIDLRGRLALPAFGDAHVHAFSGGLESLRCNLLGLRTRHECLERVAAWAATLPGDAWVLGGGWSMEAFPGGSPGAADLDAVTGGRPAFLPNRDHHSAWVNTRALALAGVDDTTPDPFDGRVERDEDGHATGALHDGAMALVARLLPPITPEEQRDGLRAALARLHREGITHWQDACVGTAGELGVFDSYDAYRRGAEEGWLTARVRGALWWDRRRGLDQMDFLRTRRERAGGNFRATSVKLMMDGVCETYTAAMARPYLGAPGRHGTHRGELFIDADELTAIAQALDADGFQMHFHAIGDRATTVALDAVASLPRERRPVGRHHIAHLQFVDPIDVPRFRELGVVANFQPLWACHDPQMDELTLPFVDPVAGASQYAIGAVRDSGGRLAFGSDWPVSSPNPLFELHTAVNRTTSARYGRAGDRECEVPFLPEQAVTLDEALRAFTSGVAYVNGDEQLLGSLEVGKQGDVVVVDHDLYAIAPREIGDCRVELTVSAGQVVFGDE